VRWSNSCSRRGGGATAAAARDAGGAAPGQEAGIGKPPIRTWVHDLFQVWFDADKSERHHRAACGHSVQVDVQHRSARLQALPTLLPGPQQLRCIASNVGNVRVCNKLQHMYHNRSRSAAPGPSLLASRDLNASTSHRVQAVSHVLAQGREAHETQCLGCETVTRTDVVFYHLSLAIEQHSSLTHCLRQFRCPRAALQYSLQMLTTCNRNHIHILRRRPAPFGPGSLAAHAVKGMCDPAAAVPHA
jgi:hypothetical protein